MKCNFEFISGGMTVYDLDIVKLQGNCRFFINFFDFFRKETGHTLLLMFLRNASTILVRNLKNKLLILNIIRSKFAFLGDTLAAVVLLF